MCPELRRDFVNVLTKEPIRRGAHYFQFVMHKIGDEQWCGVTADSSTAGARFSGRSLDAWTYYCGRQGHHGSIYDGKAALHARRRAVMEFDKPRGEGGDTIGMVVDVDSGALAFDLNGKFQGACAVPHAPLYVLTHLDDSDDHVELLKLSTHDAPQASLEALKGPLGPFRESSEDMAGYHGPSDLDSDDSDW